MHYNIHYSEYKRNVWARLCVVVRKQHTRLEVVSLIPGDCGFFRGEKLFFSVVVTQFLGGLSPQEIRIRYTWRPTNFLDVIVQFTLVAKPPRNSFLGEDGQGKLNFLCSLYLAVFVWRSPLKKHLLGCFHILLDGFFILKEFLFWLSAPIFFKYR